MKKTNTPHHKIFLFLLAFCLSTQLLPAQNQHLISGKSMIELKKENVQDVFMQARLLKLKFPVPIFSKPITNFNRICPALPCLTAPEAFFCRLELKIEKKLHFPFKFRLGDVDYVDYLEGKRRSY